MKKYLGVKGESGLRGEKGDAGSFDFFMLMMADLRHDLEQLQARVFPSSRDSNRPLPRYLSKWIDMRIIHMRINY